MIKIEKLGKTDGVLEMRGTIDELTAETIIIMRTLADRLEAETDISADVHIAAMAEVATAGRLKDAFNNIGHIQPGVDLGVRDLEMGERR